MLQQCSSEASSWVLGPGLEESTRHVRVTRTCRECFSTSYIAAPAVHLVESSDMLAPVAMIASVAMAVGASGLPTSSHLGVTMDLAPACGVEGPPPTTTVWTDALELGLLGRGWPIEAMGGPYARFWAASRFCGKNGNSEGTMQSGQRTVFSSAYSIAVLKYT